MGLPVNKNILAPTTFHCLHMFEIGTIVLTPEIIEQHDSGCLEYLLAQWKIVTNHEIRTR